MKKEINNVTIQFRIPARLKKDIKKKAKEYKTTVSGLIRLAIINELDES